MKSLEEFYKKENKMYNLLLEVHVVGFALNFKGVRSYHSLVKTNLLLSLVKANEH